MTRILKGQPLPHVLVCDTNILWHEDKAPVASPDFEIFWAKHVAEFDLSLVIPDIVKGELLFQHWTSCHKLLKSTEDNIQKISTITSATHSIRLTSDRIKSQIERKFDKWIRGHKATVLPLPVSSIDWSRVANDAIWRVYPFVPDAKNPDAEKGFRDTLIMETVCEFVRNDKRAINIAFLCNDHALRTATVARLKADSRFVAYDTLKDFESYLSLTKEKLTNEFIAKILSRARARFFTQDDASCLLLRDNLTARLQGDFREYFEDVSKSEKASIFSLGFGSANLSWTPTSSGNFWIQSPEFVRIESGAHYVWKSVVRYVRLYSRTAIAGGLLATLTQTAQTEEKVLLLPFHITWSSKVKADARFHDLQVARIELVENEFRTPTEEELKVFKLKETTG